MSTDEEIRSVYEAEIAEKTKIVLNKQGIVAFLENQGYSVHDVFEGVVSEEDKRLLQRILDAEVEDGTL